MPVALCLLLLHAEPVAEQPDTGAVEEEVETRELSERDLVEEDDYEIRLSLPTEEDFEAWRSRGLRVELAIANGAGYGLGPAPDLRGLTVGLRPRVRLDPNFSLALAFAYNFATGPFGGVAWSVTVEPVFHPVGGLNLSAGIGYGGLTGSRSEYVTEPSALVASRDALPEERLEGCTGAGWSANSRVEYLFVVGPLFAFGPHLQVDGRWTRCADGVGETDVETGQPIELMRWWSHWAWRLGLGLVWR